MSSPHRPTLTVRALLVAMAVGAGLYVAVVGVYIVLTLKPAAAVLQTRTEALGAQYQVLRGRATFLRDALVHARALSLARVLSPADLAKEHKLRAELISAAEGSAALQANLLLTGSSPAMRSYLADAAGAESRLAGVLLEALDYLELGDFRAAEARLGGADTSRMVMVQNLDESQRLGLADLATRERQLVATASRIANAVLVWVALGAVLLGLASLLVRRRLYVPLAAIDRGLTRVESGELDTELPIQREDEMGRLKAHFNQMTSVLRTRSEEERRRRTNLVERFGRILDQSFNEIYLIDATTLRIVQANRGAQAALGYTPEQFAAMTLLDVIHGFEEAGLRELVRPLRDGTQPRVVFAATHQRRDGSHYPVEISLQLWATEDPAVFVAIAQDATERRRREALQQATQRISEAALTAPNLQELYAAIHGTIAVLMPARNIYFALYDAESDLITFPYFVDEYDQPPEPKHPGRGLTEYVLRTGWPLLGTPEVFEALVRHGEVEPLGAPSVDWLGVPLVADGKTIGVLVVQSYGEGVRYGDVELSVLKFVSTQVAMAIARKRSTEALRASETKYRSLVEHAALGISRTTFEGRFVAVNPALVKMLGFDSEAELLALDLAPDLYVNPEDRRRLVAQYRDAEHVEGVEVEWKRKDGKPITVRLSGRPMRDETFAGFEMMIEDVTARRVLEAQFRQSQKMEAIGQLAGGVAHDFNNLLTAVLASGDLLRSALPADSPLSEDADAISRAARHGAELTQKLLAFSRRQPLEIRTLSLGAVAEAFTRMARRVVPEDVEVVLRVAAPDGTIRADQGAVEQILMNLVTNARDAMPTGGKLLIEIGRGTLDQEHREAYGWGEPGEYVTLVVSDTGVGMDAETLRHIFEPFFTSKPTGQGTGLGMSTVYGLVKQQNGFVHVYSEPGRGTTVRVYFPVFHGEAAAIVEQETPAVRGGSETIFLVEDNEAVRRAAKRVLAKFGYQVLTASDGAEALQVMASGGPAPDLIISDVVMPGTSGPELLARLREAGPVPKFLFTSGYTERDVHERTKLDPHIPFLAKPWTVNDLLRKVREVLDTPG